MQPKSPLTLHYISPLLSLLTSPPLPVHLTIIPRITLPVNKSIMSLIDYIYFCKHSLKVNICLNLCWTLCFLVNVLNICIYTFLHHVIKIKYFFLFLTLYKLEMEANVTSLCIVFDTWLILLLQSRIWRQPGLKSWVVWGNKLSEWGGQWEMRL